jgi:hypothetical protein
VELQKERRASYVCCQRTDGSGEVKAGTQEELGVDRLVWDKPLGAEVAKAIPSMSRRAALLQRQRTLRYTSIRKGSFVWTT